MIDWGLGHYEHTATELEPVAEHVVSLAEVRSGERVLDLACGTGNAALLAARAGAEVTGIDASQRLIGVARNRAADAGLSASFAVADLHALPFEDGSFEIALSVFGLIFAADARRAFADMLRVLRPEGRAFVSAWIPAGPIDRMVGVFGQAIATATGQRPERFPWHDEDAVSQLAAGENAEVQFHAGDLRIVAESPEAYLAANQRHPMSVAASPLLEGAGTLEATRQRALAVLREGNEDPSAFRVTSPYRVIQVRRSTRWAGRR